MKKQLLVLLCIAFIISGCTRRQPEPQTDPAISKEHTATDHSLAEQHNHSQRHRDLSMCKHGHIPLFSNTGPYWDGAFIIQGPTTLSRYVFGSLGYMIGAPLGLFGYAGRRGYAYCTPRTWAQETGFYSSAIIGFPFVALKGVFWDYPKWLFWKKPHSQHQPVS